MVESVHCTSKHRKGLIHTHQNFLHLSELAVGEEKTKQNNKHFSFACVHFRLNVSENEKCKFVLCIHS